MNYILYHREDPVLVTARGTDFIFKFSNRTNFTVTKEGMVVKYDNGIIVGITFLSFKPDISGLRGEILGYTSLDGFMKRHFKNTPAFRTLARKS